MASTELLRERSSIEIIEEFHTQVHDLQIEPSDNQKKQLKNFIDIACKERGLRRGHYYACALNLFLRTLEMDMGEEDAADIVANVLT